MRGEYFAKTDPAKGKDEESRGGEAPEQGHTHHGNPDGIQHLKEKFAGKKGDQGGVKQGDKTTTDEDVSLFKSISPVSG